MRYSIIVDRIALFGILLGYAIFVGCSMESQHSFSSSSNAPSATITSLTDGSSYAEGDSITFRGNGDDTEDGTLSGSSLVWTSDINGQIGTGTSFTKNDLSVGTHTITLTASDSSGATGMALAEITLRTLQFGETPFGEAVFH